ncbi:putative integral membrane protein (TIGR00698 family) [Azospirillum lipoferum]|uniref:Putative sulfate exporter family transporter n=1 Tax=Azospirillum lipoferum TaxID=193 RepID=A0A5A9G9U3_AZOLI|nr:MULTISPECIES: putative sulfate exporter family transporter [Azospirillum]KAA0590484.1 putative sulfate exporter family transporter [Azospirillum lipoferum]MCP1613375.1 putative integral membrane protein (TIGR00698 family) [Azospirillum lipoferum]MDW5533187.1 putative sulfate exporter family transporter [Azospirillum sp. NL1]
MTPDTAAPEKAVPGKPALAHPALAHIRRLLPGLALCVTVTALAFAAASAEVALFGEVWIEALVLAILIGTTLRSLWTPSARWQSGIAFSAKILLEVAVVLLGASVSAATILSAGPSLLLGIAGVVALALLAGFGIGRLLGLPVRMAVLVACGNAICGNSAIAAVAPVIDAHSDDVAASIAFTAVLGVAVVLGLPLLGMGLRLSGVQYGALAGLTVYAVPQVIAAATPLGATAVQVGTLVKLVRVLMLGPVCLLLSLLAPRLGGEAAASAERPRPARPPVHHLVPWFIQGFLAMIALRSFDLIPQAALPAMEHAATLLTVVSMAALGLGVDVRTVARAGGRVTAAVVLSLLALGTISLTLIHLIGLT